MTYTTGKPVKVSVVITCHNYAEYVEKAVDSVLAQTIDSYEVIVVNDGSTDSSPEIIKKYENKFERVRSLDLPGVGLATAANRGIAASKGKYIVRLDADDFFDENILLVESNILDRHPEIGLVYPDYFRVDRYDQIIDYYKLRNKSPEDRVRDRPPLAAGAMYRRECYEKINGYNEVLKFQEDFDFWYKFTDQFNTYNVNLPLMYYRKHPGSMSTNQAGKTNARQFIKRTLTSANREPDTAKNRYAGVLYAPDIVKIGGTPLAHLRIEAKSLLEIGIEELRQSKIGDQVYVLTNSTEIEEISVRHGLRTLGTFDKKFFYPGVKRADLVREFYRSFVQQATCPVTHLITKGLNFPFLGCNRVNEAIDSISLFGYNSIISVLKIENDHWKPATSGLVPERTSGVITRDEDSLYVEEGGLRLVTTDACLKGSWLGASVGHLEIDGVEALEVKDQLSLELARVAAKHRPSKMKENEYIRT